MGVYLALTLGELQAWGISLITQTGPQFDLGTPLGKLIASLMSVLSELERDLLRERVRAAMPGSHKNTVQDIVKRHRVDQAGP